MVDDTGSEKKTNRHVVRSGTTEARIVMLDTALERLGMARITGKMDDVDDVMGILRDLKRSIESDEP
jgi:hypothetical protein